ncbi:MAG TPA: hypothetical protein VN636_03410 [Acidimicrobiia bacterium]|nr:hypothetical protein [Acidimicrobiia bacterium]
MTAARRVLCTTAYGPHLDLFAITGPALERYARAHGYETVVVHERLDRSRPPAWDKVVLLHALVPEHDLVVWVDADALVLDGAPDIAGALRPRAFAHLVAHRTPRGRIPNTGVMALRGGRVTERFLEHVWVQRRFVHHRWWDNAAVNHVLGFRGAHRSAAIVPSLWRARVGFIDRAWNSIPDDRSPAPHIVHFPGIPLDERRRALELAAAGS